MKIGGFFIINSKRMAVIKTVTYCRLIKMPNHKRNKKATWISGFLAVGEKLPLLSELEQPSYVA